MSVTVVSKSAEHHFFKTLESIKAAPRGRAALYFIFAQDLPHKALIKDLGAMSAMIAAHQVKAAGFAEKLAAQAGALGEVTIYIFTDGDVLLLTAGGDTTKARALYEALAGNFGEGRSDFAALEHEFYRYEKLADEKILSARRFEAYAALGDAHKISSIAARRSRRGQSRVMIVEDDRFTASYTAGLLGKDYDLVMCASGEDAILNYIETAPDAVFLDVHLPGLSGHETLDAIKAADPQAYIVMLSVDTVKDSIVRAAEGGARNFLKKPFSKERLLNVVKNSPHIRGFDMSKGESLP